MLNTDWTPLIVCPKQMSMKRCDVRPFVCSSMGSQQQTRCCRYVAFCGPGEGRIYRSISAAAGRVVNECGQCEYTTALA